MNDLRAKELFVLGAVSQWYNAYVGHSISAVKKANEQLRDAAADYLNKPKGVCPGAKECEGQ
jgi:hypothetical protein